MKTKLITVLLAEDHAIVREGLRNLLQLSGGFEVVGEATTGREAVDLAKALQPDVIVMDIAMPNLNGFEATRQIQHLSPRSKVLVLSAHSDDEYVEHLLSVGVSAYLIKQNSGQVLVHAINEVMNGRTYFSPTIAARMQTQKFQAQQRGDQETARRPLTSRETEVLQLVAEGSSNKQIASGLGISIKTVEKHRQQVMDKLNIHETAGLTRHAISTGIIEVCTQNTTNAQDL